MHSSGSITRMRSAWWMQSTGQTSTQERSLMSMQGSAMMYVTAQEPYSGGQLLDDLSRTLLQRVLDEHLVEAGLVRAAETCGIRVPPEADDRDLRIRIRDIERVDAADVGDHEVRPIRAVRRDEVMVGAKDFELAPKVDIDPTKQDRRHARRVPRRGHSVKSRPGNYRSGR